MQVWPPFLALEGFHKQPDWDAKAGGCSADAVDAPKGRESSGVRTGPWRHKSVRSLGAFSPAAAALTPGVWATAFGNGPTTEPPVHVNSSDKEIAPGLLPGVLSKAASQTRHARQVLAEGSRCPTSHPVKGTINREGGACYKATRPEGCFLSASVAQAEGFRASLK